MGKPTIITGSTWEDSGAILMAQVTGNAGALITAGTFTDVTYSIRNKHDVATETATAALSPVSTYVFDALQTEAVWTKDAKGYNFRWDAPASLFPLPGVWRIEVRFNPSSGEDFFVVFEITVERIYMS